MNTYRTEFFATCPTNGVRIKYVLMIKTGEVIPVEQIVAKVESLESGFHEEFADEFSGAFGGQQTLVAEHHSVSIETERP